MFILENVFCRLFGVGVRGARVDVGSLLSGLSLTRVRGGGLLLSGVREFHPGDDARRVLWRLVARDPGFYSRGRLLVGEYEEEHARRVQVLVLMLDSLLFEGKMRALGYVLGLLGGVFDALEDDVVWSFAPMGREYSGPWGFRGLCRLEPAGDVGSVEGVAGLVKPGRDAVFLVGDYNVPRGLVSAVARRARAYGSGFAAFMVYSGREVEPPLEDGVACIEWRGHRVCGDLDRVYEGIRGHVDAVSREAGRGLLRVRDESRIPVGRVLGLVLSARSRRYLHV